MLTEEMKKSERWEIELAILKAIKSHNGKYHQSTLAKALGYSFGTVAKYTLSFLDRKILANEEDGRNQKLLVTEETDKEIRKLESHREGITHD